MPVTIDGGTGSLVGLLSIQEAVDVVAAAPDAVTNVDVRSYSVRYFTTNASANFTLNVRGDGSNTFSSVCPVGRSFTMLVLVTNGATAYRPTTFQIDGTAITPKWGGGSAPTAGNANSIDAYTISITKTAATPTYTMFVTQVRFA